MRVPGAAEDDHVRLHALASVGAGNHMVPGQVTRRVGWVLGTLAWAHPPVVPHPGSDHPIAEPPPVPVQVARGPAPLETLLLSLVLDAARARGRPPTIQAGSQHAAPDAPVVRPCPTWSCP